MTTQVQGPNSDRVDPESTVVLAGVSRSVPPTSDEAYGQLVDPHLWPVEALERVPAAIESTR